MFGGFCFVLSPHPVFEESPESAERNEREVRIQWSWESRGGGNADAAGLGARLEKRRLEKYQGRPRERAETGGKLGPARLSTGTTAGSGGLL